MTPTIAPPVRPYRGTRGTDSWGSGVFGASRDGGGRAHSGLDCIAVPGDMVVAPFPGVIVRLGVAYAFSTLGSIHLHGHGDFEGWEAKLLYVEPDPGLGGRTVAMGDRLGEAQDVAAYWKAKQPDHVGEMKNHCHIEIRVTIPHLIDPLLYFPDNLVVSKDTIRT